MFYDEPNHKDKGSRHKDASLDLVGLVFIGVLIAIPFFLYLIS